VGVACVQRAEPFGGSCRALLRIGGCDAAGK
jgi:hypothetical protein